MTFFDLAPALPEIFLAVATVALLLFGTFRGDRAMRAESVASVAILLIALGMIWGQPAGEDRILFNGLFIVDTFGQFMKSILLIGAILAITMGETYAEREGMHRFEYPIVIMLATLGTMLMVSAHDMLSLYVGLELQSLALYILAAFKRDDRRSSEAGLKYFVLGALSSGILLYGVSLVYGATGTTNYLSLAIAFQNGGASPLALTGFVLIVCGLAFKIAAAPFHMWAPDVYQGAPTSVTAFFASVPKVAAFAVMLRVFFEPFGNLPGPLWQQLLMVLAVSSMIIGAFAALRQTNIKRLMAYSSIGHVGYALVGMAAGGEAGVQAVLIYLVIYFMMTLGVFAVILTLRRGGRMVEEISDLAGLGKQHPTVALCMVILMFSMAGVPPLAGFFGKFYAFMAAVDAGLYALAVVGVLLSTVSAYYYLRIIKVMYFDEPSALGAIDPVPELNIRAVLGITSIYLVVFAFVPSPVLGFAAKAAASLLG